jgi:hypothetical protein
VGRSQRAGRFVGIDDGRDIALRRSLRDRTNVDTGAAERAEKAGCDARRPGHAVANHRHDAL